MSKSIVNIYDITNSAVVRSIQKYSPKLTKIISNGGFEPIYAKKVPIILGNVYVRKYGTIRDREDRSHWDLLSLPNKQKTLTIVIRTILRDVVIIDLLHIA